MQPHRETLGWSQESVCSRSSGVRARSLFPHRVSGVTDPFPLTQGFELEHIDGSTWPTPPDALMARMLVLVAHTTNEAIPAGTGFLISGDGKLVTAEHVASRLKELVGEVRGEAIVVKALIPSAADGGAVLVRKLWTNPEDDPRADITVGILSLPANAPLLPAFEVAFEQLAVGETIMVLGFASMTQKMDSDAISAFVLNAELKGVLTTVMALHPDGCTNLRGPVFEMAAPMDPGMSGGPIIRVATGEVVGVCSYGSKAPEVEPYCFGSILRPENLQQVMWG